MFGFLNDPVAFLLESSARLPAILFAISFHEAAHAWMAYRCGDPTAARMGRITLNPIAHFDPIGFLAIVFLPIGWGKPVPYVGSNLRNPHRDAMYIAAAGPASNILLAAIFGMTFRLLFYCLNFVDSEGALARMLFFLLLLAAWSVFINLMLCFFNLIPLFPLDGEKVLFGLFPSKARELASFRQYGPMFLILLILFGNGPILFPYLMITTTPFSWLFSGLSPMHLYSVIVNVSENLW